LNLSGSSATLPVEPIPAARAKRTTFKMPAAGGEA
jgi:hypothetical protein